MVVSHACPGRVVNLNIMKVFFGFLLIAILALTIIKDKHPINCCQGLFLYIRLNLWPNFWESISSLKVCKLSFTINHSFAWCLGVTTPNSFHSLSVSKFLNLAFDWIKFSAAGWNFALYRWQMAENIFKINHG